MLAVTVSMCAAMTLSRDKPDAHIPEQEVKVYIDDLSDGIEGKVKMM